MNNKMQKKKKKESDLANSPRRLLHSISPAGHGRTDIDIYKSSERIYPALSYRLRNPWLMRRFKLLT